MLCKSRRLECSDGCTNVSGSCASGCLLNSHNLNNFDNGKGTVSLCGAVLPKTRSANTVGQAPRPERHPCATALKCGAPRGRSARTRPLAFDVTSGIYWFRGLCGASNCIIHRFRRRYAAIGQHWAVAKCNPASGAPGGLVGRHSKHGTP